jgi:hypothetical protein
MPTISAADARRCGDEPRLAHANDLDAAAIEIENGLQVADHAPPELVERPQHEHVERAMVGVAHHAFEHRPHPCRARLLLVLGDEFEPSHRDHALDVWPLVVGVALALAHAQVDRCPAAHAAGGIITPSIPIHFPILPPAARFFTVARASPGSLPQATRLGPAPGA